MGVLCIQRTLASGLATGLATGLGAATVHVAFGWTAALGLAAAADLWSGAGTRVPLLLSSCLLFYFAIRAFGRRMPARPVHAEVRGFAHSYMTALLLGFSNPLTVLLFAAALPAVLEKDGFGTTSLFVAGVFLGSAGWWVALSSSVALIRSRLSDATVAGTNRASGLVLASLGAIMFANACGLKLP
jgi:threonine/homoserine/homoserine lactone efflux protein